MPPGSRLTPSLRWLQSLSFVAGAALMALEILASRILAPAFGTGVMVWASLIGLFLVSMAAGAWLGGSLSDRHPSGALLHGLVLSAAVWIAAVPAVGAGLCLHVAGAGIGPRAGPLLATGLLFLVPCVLLGAVTPFSLRLAAPPSAGLGGAAGRLSALATAGGIVGTFGAAFFLLHAVGVRASFLVIAAALAPLPLAWLALDRSARAPLATLGLLLAGQASLAGRSEPGLAPGLRLVWEEDTPYHHLRVVEDDRTRTLRFGPYEEAGVTLAPPHRSALGYTDALHLVRLATPSPRRLLLLGGGVGVVARELLADLPEASATLVDLDPAVVKAARRWFFLADDPRLTVVAADARRYLAGHPGPWDAVVVDAFSAGGRIPFHLATREFFGLLRSRLAPGGAAVYNVIGALEGRRSALPAAIASAALEVFRSVEVFPLPTSEPRLDADRRQRRNLVLLLRDAAAPRVAPERAAALVASGATSVAGLAALARRGETLPPDWRRVTALTDDRAPVELLPF